MADMLTLRINTAKEEWLHVLPASRVEKFMIQERFLCGNLGYRRLTDSGSGKRLIKAIRN
jgi:hypothetical protein